MEYHRLEKGELKKTLAEKQTAWRALRFGGSGAKSTNVKAARELRREIARLLTVLQTKAEAK